MHKLWAVIRREFVARVRTRSFVITTVLGPVLMAVLIIAPAILSTRQTSSRRIVVLDGGAGPLARVVDNTLRMTLPANMSLELVVAGGELSGTLDSLIGLIDPPEPVAATAIDGIVVLDPATLAHDSVTYLGSNVSSMTDMGSLRRGLQQALMADRLTRMGVDLSVVQQANRPFAFVTERVAEGKLTGESGEASFALAYVMAFLLYMALLLYGVQVMGAVVEEKSNRINEVLVSSLTPFQLLMGKVVGVGSAGLLQLSIWMGTATILTTFRAQIASLIGVDPQAVMGFDIPTISPDLLAVFLVFFLLGFFLYSAAYAAVGATCNSMQETQQSSMPVTLTIVVGFFMVFNMLNDPGGSLAHVLTLVPLFAPLIVPVRYSLNPLSLPELAASFTVTALGVLAMVWLAGRVYRVGILAHGKRPRIKEIMNWVRAG